MIRVHCPRCQTRFTTSDANAGKTGQCPKCGNPIQVPKAGPAPAKPQAAPSQAEAGRGTASAASDSAVGEARRHAAAQAPAAKAPTQPAAPSAQRAAPAPSQPQPQAEPTEAPAGPQGKSKVVALVLCIFLGALGTHRFYMGSWGWGLVIFALNLLCIGGVIFAIVDVFRLATISQEDFQARYNEMAVEPFTF